MTLIEPGTFIASTGNLGSGKTLNTSRIGALAALAGQRVYANYKTSFAEPINSLEDLYSLRDSVILWDELQATLDSREFAKNIEITQWIFIVRKLKLSIVYTTQFLGQVDLRVRHITSMIYVCRSARHYGAKCSHITLLDWFGEGGSIRTSFILPHSQVLYNLYDTYDTEVRLTTSAKGGRVRTFNAPSPSAAMETVPPPPEAGTVASSKSVFSRR